MLVAWFLLFLSFFGTLYVMPHSIRKLSSNGLVAKDMYKYNKPEIATNAGIILIFTSFISIALLPIFVLSIKYISLFEISVSNLTETNLALLVVVSIYGMYGLVDDLVDIGRKSKLLLPVVFGYPLISIVSPSFIWIPFIGDFDLSRPFYEEVEWNDVFRVTIIPVYIMVVSNLVNMHSGYNGMQSGLSIIIISTLLFKSFLDGKLESVIPVFSFLGSILAFWIYNKYPSKVFEGNIGSLMFGSLIGSVIVIQQYWWFGFFILLPHTFNFLLWIFWLIMMKRNPSKYLLSGGVHQKFGKVDKNGSINVPNMLTLKWIPTYLFNFNEKSSVLCLYSLTFLFCLLGLLIFN